MTIAQDSRIGIASPHIFSDGTVDMALVGRFVRRAEELGYASLWTQERVTGHPTILDPLTFMSYIAGLTTKARIGVSVFVLTRHNPVHLAKQLASIDQMSGGRLITGVGLGVLGSSNASPLRLGVACVAAAVFGVLVFVHIVGLRKSERRAAADLRQIEDSLGLGTAQDVKHFFGTLAIAPSLFVNFLGTFFYAALGLWFLILRQT